VIPARNRKSDERAVQKQKNTLAFAGVARPLSLAKILATVVSEIEIKPTKMNPEIEELRKFTNVTVTKARLEKLRAALSNATMLFNRLEPKPGDENATEEFESAQTELESALFEVESACDDLGSAEDKDEREDAQGQISSALEDVLNYFDEIMLVAVVGDAANAKVRDDFKAMEVKLASVPREQWVKHLADWMAGAPTPEENKKRAAYLFKVLKKNKKPPEAEQSQSPP